MIESKDALAGDEDVGERFEPSEAVQGCLATCLLLLLSLVTLSAAVLWLKPTEPGERSRHMAFVVFFSALAVLTCRALWSTRDRYRVGARGITRLRPGREPVALAWGQITRIVDRPGRLELHGEGSEGPVVFRLSRSLRAFERLLDLVMERTDWVHLIAEPGEVLRLPAVIHRSRFLLALAWGLGFGLFVWHRLLIERGQLTFVFPLWRWTYGEEDVWSVRLDEVEGGGRAVIVRTNSGSTHILDTARGSQLRLYVLLGLAFPEKVR